MAVHVFACGVNCVHYRWIICNTQIYWRCNLLVFDMQNIMVAFYDGINCSSRYSILGPWPKKPYSLRLKSRSDSWVWALNSRISALNIIFYIYFSNFSILNFFHLKNKTRSNEILLHISSLFILSSQCKWIRTL